MSNKSAAAGGRFEAWLAKWFKKRGWHSDRLRSFQVKGEPDLYATKADIVFDIQAKERQNLNTHEVLMDLIDAQVEIMGRIDPNYSVPAIPLVIYKRMQKRGETGRRTQRGPVTVTMRLEDFAQIVERADLIDELLEKL